MKRIRFSVAAAALLALPCVVSAQSVTTTGGVNYKAEYLGAGAVAFGAFDPGVAQSIALTSTGRGYQGLRFNGKSVVTFTSSGTLTQSTDAQGNNVTAGAATFRPTYSCAVLDDDGVQASYSSSNTSLLASTTSTDCFTGNTLTLDLVGNKRTTRWVIVGGAVSTSATQDLPAGNYAGSVTVSIAKSAT